MLIHVAFLLILPIMCQTKIQINVTVASHIADVIVEFKGEDNKVITEHEEQLYNMTKANLNRGMRVELGKVPDNIFLKDPTRYGNLFNHFKWPEVKRNLRVVKAKVLELINKEAVIKTHEHINNSSDTIKIIRSLHSDMESSIYSSWLKTGLPAEDLYYDVIVNFDETVFKYQNKWRDRTLRSTPIRIAKSKKGFISIKPGQTLVTELKAFKTVFTVRLEYEARLVGNLIGDYDYLYGKYHFYSPTIANIMKAAGMTNLIKTTESLEVVCYSDPSLNVYDKDTGLTVRSDISRRWFKNLKRNKVLVLLLGASITAGLFVFHVAVVPLIFKYSKTFRRSLIFANFVQWPLYIDYEEPSARGIEGGRNLSIQYQSKIDNCTIKIGIWHILSKSAYEKLKRSFEDNVDPEELSKTLDDELANSRTPIMMYCHGNSNSRAATHRIQLYKFFQKMDFHTIAFDYRGYGDSTNVNPSEDGVVEDSLVVYEWLNNTVDKGPNRPPIFVWGHSLGTGISSHLLGNLKELSNKVLDRSEPLPLPQGLILEAPFNNLADEVAKHPLSKLVTWLPYYESTFVSPFRNAVEYSFKSDEHLSRTTTLPVLILHAEDDVIVPFVVGLKLYKSILESRSIGGATVKLHKYDKKQSLGHKWICQAEDLQEVVGYYLFGTNVALICFLIYLCSPFLVLSHKFRCYGLYMNKIQWPPFLNHSNIKDFGIDGGRHFMLKFDSTIAKQELELGVWHILPRSLCDVVNSMSFSSDEEISNFFNDQLRNSGKPIILYCHGISQSRGNNHRTKMYKVMQDLDAHVITFDYRGFADSTNVMPTKIGLVEDTLAVYAWLKGVSGDDSKVFMWGHSMGGGVICKVMSGLEEYSSSLLQLERPLPLPRGAIIESSFTHVKESLKDFTPLDFFVMLPHFKALVRSTFVSDADVRINSAKYVQSVKTVPFLMLHSRDDDIVLLSLGQKLYDTVKSSRTVNDAPVSLELFDGRGHMWICDDERLPKIAGDFIYAHTK